MVKLSKILHSLGIEPKTSCSADALVTTEPRRQSRTKIFLCFQRIQNINMFLTDYPLKTFDVLLIQNIIQIIIVYQTKWCQYQTDIGTSIINN